ncbi:MAG: hypothetical protein ABSA93_35495, partial [Streptosporangiaceae bacterium]
GVPPAAADLLRGGLGSGALGDALKGGQINAADLMAGLQPGGDTPPKDVPAAFRGNKRRKKK